MNAPVGPVAPTRPRDDPSALLESTFQHIADTRMRDIPILNPRLAVEAVGFCRWQQHWLGILITPWFINILCLPGDDRSAEPLVSGTACSLDLPSGRYEFFAASESRLGEYLSCSLFSPVLQFADQNQAREVARAAMNELMQSPSAPSTDVLAAEGAARRSLFRRLSGAG